MKRILAAMALAAATATPQVAWADEMYAVTPNGAVETDFAGAPADAIAKLSNRCIDAKWQVISSSNSTLVCESPMSMGQSILGQALLGNSYSTPPRRYFQFNAAQAQGYTRVQASGWMELQMAFGQIQRTDFSGPEFANSILGFMVSAGGQLPVGTTFPNHAIMGVEGKWTPSGRTSLFTVQKVSPDSAAQAAGILPDDVIKRMAGKAINSEANLLDGQAKAAKTPTYEVEVVRDGKVQRFTLNRAFRPAIAKLDFPDTEPAASVATGQSGAPAQAVSVADELAKFAKLRDQGIISAEEFEVQKKKLLGM